MNKILKSVNYLVFLSGFLICFAFGDPKAKKLSKGTCSADKYCTACSTCEYCRNCAKRGGVCGVCSPQSFEAPERKKQPVTKPAPEKKPEQKKQQPAAPKTKVKILT